MIHAATPDDCLRVTEDGGHVPYTVEKKGNSLTARRRGLVYGIDTGGST